MKKFLCLILCLIFILGGMITSFAANESDCHAYWKLETNSTVATGKTVEVKIYLKTDYVCNIFGAVVTYDKTFYEPASSTEADNFVISSNYSSLGNKAVVMSEMRSQSVAEKMYHSSYTSQMRNKYGLAWFSFTFLASKFSNPSTDLVPRFNDYCHVATLKLKVKSSAKSGLVGDIRLDEVYQQTEAGSSKYTFAGHGNSEIIGQCNTTVKYGQTVDFSNAVLFKSVKMNDLQLQYKQSANIAPEVMTFGSPKLTYSYSSSDPSVVSVDGDGNIKTLKRGSADITCVVTDSNGATAFDKCTVSVSYAWWQWIIIIFLFGWIWY